MSAAITASSAPLLELSGVHTHIAAYHILHGVHLVVPRGEVTMLLGRNGAGKTTTLRTIMGLWRASQGTVKFAGQDITRFATPQIAGLGIAYVPETMGIFGDLTVRENMVLAARSARTAAQIDAERLAWIFQLFPAVEKFWNHPAGKLSGGQKQMLAVARAIVDPAGRAEHQLRQTPGRQRRGHGQRRRRAHRAHGGAGARRGAAALAAGVGIMRFKCFRPIALMQYGLTAMKIIVNRLPARGAA